MAIVGMRAQGWPANYGGVMLQGFYWDSYDDTRWTNLTSQVDELSAYYDLIWVPNSGQTKEDRWNSSGNWGYENMGYMPVYWLKHNTCFGTEQELKEMIAAFKAKGTGIIEDVVINHKNGLSNWADFPNENITTSQKTYTLTWATDMTNLWGICQDDELFSNGGVHDGTTYRCATSTSDCLVSNDEGDNFDGCRDLDHTNAQVQQNIATYLDYLVNELGYAGFRYDMVKGYAGYYVGKYNSELSWPDGQENMFSVGEYWDASYDNVVHNWIDKTALPSSANGQKQSAAFDFPLKYAINDAFNNGHWSLLQANKGIAGDPNMSRYSVTFVDNHDTYRNDYDRVNNNVLAANAFILGLPGTPCIFLPHWQQYKAALMKMIAARKAAGITNQSVITYDGSNDGGFYMKVTGEKGSVIVLCGQPSLDNEQLNSDINNWHKLVCSGENFAFYLSTNDNIYDEQIFNDIEENYSNEVTVYVIDDHGSAPYLYAYGSRESNGGWPGTQMSEKVQLADGQWWYKKTLRQSELNVVLSNGHKQTDNITNLKKDIYLRLTDTGAEKLQYGITHFFDGDTESDYIYSFVENTNSWNTMMAWAWDNGFYNSANYTGGNWPGQVINKVGISSSGKDIFLWRIAKNTVSGVPSQILFNVGNSDGKTADLDFVNGGYYDTGGLTSADMISLDASKVLEGVKSATATNWNGLSETVAEVKATDEVKPSLGIYFPAGTYTVQAIVRGTEGSSVSLAAGTSSSSMALTGMTATSASTVTTDGISESYVSGTNGGWQKVQSTYTMAQDGVLPITLSSDASTWQVGTLTILKGANTSGKYQTVGTTQTTQTLVDVTGENHFSFYDRGANPNALIKANSGQAASNLPYNVIVDGTCASLRLTDGAYDFNAYDAFTATAVAYNRSFTPGKKVTVCLPFAVSADEMTEKGITAYRFDEVLSDGSLHFTSVDEMAANTPYVLVVSEDNTTPFGNLGGRTVSKTGSLEQAIDGVTFTGTMKRLTLNSGETLYYGYTNGEFVKVGSNVGINPFRAYLKTTTELGASVSVTFEDVSAIRDLTRGNSTATDDLYTLGGLKVSNASSLPKGIYIKGGKKLIIK